MRQVRNVHADGQQLLYLAHLGFHLTLNFQNMISFLSYKGKAANLTILLLMSIEEVLSLQPAHVDHWSRT